MGDCKVKVSNMISAKGNPVANQFIITDGYKEVFQSYGSTIAIIEGGKVVLDSYYWDYSATTGRYRNAFLGEGIATTRKKIESGEYTLDNLN